MSHILRSSDSLPAEWDAALFAATLRNHLTWLQADYGLKSLALFGSYVRNEQAPGSDLDVLVEYARTPTLLDVARPQRELCELLGVPVDLVLHSTLRPDFGRRIMQDRVAI